MIKYGLLGFGLNAIGHWLELRVAPKLRGRSKLICAFDPNPNSQETMKKRLGADVKIATSFEDFLNTPEMEAVIVSSPPQYHADQVVSSLESGKHVFSEVPMAINKEDVMRIVKAEENSGKKYQYGENYIFLSEVLYAGHLSSSGKIGPTVYAESEYLHDVTYRWRQGNHGGPDTPKVKSWYSLFDPLAYAHSIGPAQVALGGLESPKQFSEVMSYANSIGAHEKEGEEPVCSPAEAFHVALFRAPDGAIAKCANAYVFAREPTRLIIQVSGKLGTYECYKIGGKGRLFLAEGHEINKFRHRKGSSQTIGRRQMKGIVSSSLGAHHGSGTRILDNWLTSIEKDIRPALHAKIGANITLAGLAASESARTKKPVEIPIFEYK